MDFANTIQDLKDTITPRRPGKYAGHKPYTGKNWPRTIQRRILKGEDPHKKERRFHNLDVHENVVTPRREGDFTSNRAEMRRSMKAAAGKHFTGKRSHYGRT